MQLRRRRFLFLTAGSAALTLSGTAMAQETYPSRPVRLIVGFTPGSASDVVGRFFAKGAESQLGQSVVVENKPGAGSSIAAKYVARSAADGYTILLMALSTLTNSITNPALGVDILKEFSPIARLASGPYVLVVNKDVDVKNVADLIALAKAKPGQVLFGSVGAGSLPHLSAEMFAQRAGIKLTHVPYPGSPQVITDLMAGRITMAFENAIAVVGQVSAGKIRALATAADKRPSALPNVPTVAEEGIPNFDVSLWFGVMAPVGTPRPVIDKIAAAAHVAMHKPDTVEALRNEGFEPFDLGPDEFAPYIRSEIARWTEVARGAGMKT
ncbi:MAG TPA: tripartite tricarboxylate transporter substrate binding protein [Pseudolabrys sp.]|nr:tripartite tricarboxylate transporter substrate binding protein [Pseudolabrys sp.]